MFQNGNLAKFKKEQNLQNQKGHAHQIGLLAFRVNLYLHEFFEPILFFDPMDYSPWSEGKFLPSLKASKKEPNFRNQRGHAHQIRFPCISGQPLLAWIFWAYSIFWPPWTIVHMVRREILAVFEGKCKGTKSPKPERSRPPKWICMHFTSTSTCMNLLSRLYFYKK